MRAALLRSVASTCRNVLSLALPLWAVAALPARATPTPALTLTDDGSSGALFQASSATTWLDTANSTYYSTSNTGDQVFDHTVPSALVTQADGSQVRVFDFTSFNLAYGDQLVVEGNVPAAILVQGSIDINGTLKVTAGGFAGGPGGQQSGPSPLGVRGAGADNTGGYGAIGINQHVGSPCCGYDTASGGGGGGKGGPGQPGVPGTLFPSGTNAPGGNGGAAETNASILRGGGGGGGSGGGYDYYGNPQYGGNGGTGGGAVIFETPGDITIGSTGIVEANGLAGGAGAAGAGSGAGGELWFDATGAFFNQGVISAQGGPSSGPAGDSNPPGSPGWGGAGGGGMVLIDPASITNDGIINVSDGNGGNAYGGQVLTFGDAILGGGGIVGEGIGLPEPPGWVLLLAAAVTLAGMRRRGRAA